MTFGLDLPIVGDKVIICGSENVKSTISVPNRPRPLQDSPRGKNEMAH